MRASPIILLFATLLSLVLASIHLPFFIKLFYPVWPVIFIFMILSLGYAKYVWFWTWALGLILDSMQHNILGTHVISMGLVLILMSKYFNNNERVQLLQSMILMGFAAGIYSLSMMSIEGGGHSLMAYVVICGQTLASVLLWPWLYIWLLKPRKKYHKMI
jgi:rod shape-determining protein MreD